MHKRLLGVVLALVVGAVVACAGSKAEEKKDPAPAEQQTGASAEQATEAPADSTAAAQSCDLWKQDCPEGQGCTWVQSQAVCISVGTLADGAACTSGNDCGKGLLCTSAGCRSLCDKDHPCAAGKCTAFTNTSDSTVGACQ